MYKKIIHILIRKCETNWKYSDVIEICLLIQSQIMFEINIKT